MPAPDAFLVRQAELQRAGYAPEEAIRIAAEQARTPGAAAGVLYRAGDCVLLLLRSPTAEDCPLTWCFPGGGIDGEETAEQAAIRESQEEVGYTPAEPLALVDFDGRFVTYGLRIAEPFAPILNPEHIGYVWAPLAALPQPLHPGVAATLARLRACGLAMDEKVIDTNGWVEVKANPISKAGIFPYSGRQLGLDGPDADRIFQVLRPPEELADPACIESFKLLPWIDEHVMLGPVAQEMTDKAVPAEKKGVQGVIGEDVFFKDGVLFANIKAFSSTLAALIQAGKRELSAGYRCIYDVTAGVWNGQPYDAVQRKIRGNHLALVKEGRMGPDVAVMDRFTFSFDAKEIQMAEENKDGDNGGAGSMTLEQVVKIVGDLAPQVAKLTDAFAKLGQPAAPAPAATDEEAGEDKGKPPVAAGEGGEGTPAGTGMDAATLERSFVERMGRRDTLARQLSAHVGTFDHSAMTLDDVVNYGCEKLGITAEAGRKGDVLAGYLQAKPATTPSATVAGNGMDAAPTKGNFVTKHLEQKGE